MEVNTSWAGSWHYDNTAIWHYRVGVKNLPDGQSALQFTRDQLDRLKLGHDLTHLPWGSKHFKLPPSQLTG